MENSRPGKARSIVSMAMGITSLEGILTLVICTASVRLGVMTVGTSNTQYTDFAFSILIMEVFLICGAMCMGFGIAAAILGKKQMDIGAKDGFCRAGRVTGIIGIVVGILMLVGCLGTCVASIANGTFRL